MTKQNSTEQAQAEARPVTLDDLAAAVADLAEHLNRIETAQLAIASQNPPNWRRPLASYFNGWPQAINAFVVASDDYGPTVVSWMGHIYTRRTGSNQKYGPTIWFSRAVGKDEGGNLQYARLITFADDDSPSAEPLPDYVKQKLEQVRRH